MKPLTTHQLADALGIGRHTVDRLRKSGAIRPVICEARTIRWDLESVRTQLQARAEAPKKRIFLA
jgi:predicted site-specific integrase-resolvase